jgi:transposase
MMGEHAKSEGLFYYFKLEDHVPQTHLLRLIDRHVDFGFLRNRLRPLYSETGRPSVDPELMIRMLLIGYLYGITSERRLCEDVGTFRRTGMGVSGNRSCSAICSRRSSGGVWRRVWWKARVSASTAL